MKTKFYILVLALVAGVASPAQAALNRHACMSCTVETPDTVLDDFRHFIRENLDVEMDAMQQEAILELRQQFGIDALHTGTRLALAHPVKAR